MDMREFDKKSVGVKDSMSIVFQDNDGVSHPITDVRIGADCLILLSRAEVIPVEQNDIAGIFTKQHCENSPNKQSSVVVFTKRVNDYPKWCSCGAGLEH